MRRFLIFLAAVVLSMSVVFADAGVPSAAVKTRQDFWSKVTASTDWGRWLLAEFRPYSDQTSKALLALSTSPNDKGRFKTCFEALRVITPPEEFKTFHTKQLALFAILATDTPKTKEEIARHNAVITKLSGDMSQEFRRVLTGHGVPADVIDELTRD